MFDLNNIPFLSRRFKEAMVDLWRHALRRDQIKFGPNMLVRDLPGEPLMVDTLVDRRSGGTPAPLRTFRITGSTPDDVENPTQHTYTAREQQSIKAAAGYDGWQDVDETDHTLYSLWEQTNETPEPIPDGTFVAAKPHTVSGEREWWIVGFVGHVDVCSLLKSLTGYDANKLQVLVNDNGECKWMDSEECAEPEP